MRHPESIIQEQVVVFLRRQYPHVLFTGGFDACKLKPQQGMRRKLAGYLAGTPDIIILKACGGYHGLMLELKSPVGVMSDSQKAFKAAAELAGYAYRMAKSLASAQEAINLYLGIP